MEEVKGSQETQTIFPRLLPKIGEDIDSFLEHAVPTEARTAYYVQVGSSRGSTINNPTPDRRKIYAGQKMLRDLLGKPKDMLTVEDIDKAALASNTLSGKWKISVPTHLTLPSPSIINPANKTGRQG